MPTPEEILNGLTLAANKFIWVSISWHIVVLAIVIRLVSVFFMGFSGYCG